MKWKSGKQITKIDTNLIKSRNLKWVKLLYWRNYGTRTRYCSVCNYMVYSWSKLDFNFFFLILAFEKAVMAMKTICFFSWMMSSRIPKLILYFRQEETRTLTNRRCQLGTRVARTWVRTSVHHSESTPTFSIVPELLSEEVHKEGT